MWKFILEFLSYSSFVCVLYVVSYSNPSSDEYQQVQHLRQFLLNPQNFTHDFSQITTITDYWKWLEESFIMKIVAQNWYNGQSVDDSQGFLDDKVNRMIGWATIRQLRVRPDTCRVKSTIQGIIPNCYDEYSGSTEERRSFSPGWTTNATIQNYSSSIKEAFMYQTSEQLDTYIYLGEYATYRSGGYVYEFRDSLSQMRNDLAQLHQLGWIDRQTRAVMIQMNLYNPSIAIFTSAVLIVEILPSSGVYSNARFEPLDFDSFKSIFQIICVVIYLTFILYFMIVEIYTFTRLKKAYFRQIWSYIELGIIVCSWTSVGIHIWHTNEAARITHLFRETNGNSYVNFQLMAYINDIFSFLLGFCCFFGTLKFLRLCRYNRRLALLSNTLKRAGKELISFSCMFSIIFMAFLTLFYLQFNSLIWACSSLLHTAEMLFEMLLLKFDATEIAGAASFLGPFYFALFILFVVFVCINMFVSIINDNFRIVREDVHKVDHDNQDVFINFLKILRQWWGEDNKVDVVIINETHRVITVAEMPAPIQRLSNKLDELTDYIDHRYKNNNVQIAWNETAVSTLNFVNELQI